MRLAIGIILAILGVWLLVSVLGCEGTLPYCIGSTTKTMFLDILRGLTG